MNRVSTGRLIKSPSFITNYKAVNKMLTMDLANKYRTFQTKQTC